MIGNRFAGALLASGALLLAPPVVLHAPATGALDHPAQAGDAVAVRLDLDGLTPRVVTTDGPATLTLSGQVVNTGQRTVSALQLRVQRGDAARDDAGLRAALSDGVPADSVVPRFTDLPGTLAPGARMPFRLAVPLRGVGPDSLQLSEPGSYPLLINLNGRPDFGGRARVAAARLLLPVLGLPAGPAGAPAVPTVPPAVAPAVTMLWPIVDVPHRLPGGLAGEPATTPGVRPTLTDDTLATEFAPAGRLGALLEALDQAAPIGSPQGRAVCLAIDPDLLATAQEMSTGYLVAGPAGPVPGTGAAVAAQWIQRLRQVAAGRCVLALPTADPDLVALARDGLTDLSATAHADGVARLRDALGSTVLTNLAWPAGGMADDRTLGDLTGEGITTVLVSPASLGRQTPGNPSVPPGTVIHLGGTPAAATPASAPPPGASAPSTSTSGASTSTSAPPAGTASADVRGLVIDPLLADALAGSGPQGITGSGTGAADATVSSVAAGSAAGTDRPLADQDGLGVLLARVTSPAPPPVVVLTPPRRWLAGADDLTALLQLTTVLFGSGLAVPAELPALIGAQATGTAGLDYPVSAAATEIPAGVVAGVGRLRDRVRDLDSAFTRDPVVQVQPAALVDPIRLALLRAVSVQRRDDPAGAAVAAGAAQGALDSLTGQVQIVQPPAPYTLGSSDSPIVLSLTNRLPVQVTVQVLLFDPPGLRTGRIEPVALPAGHSRGIQVATQVVRAGQFSVQARLATPGGTPLGDPAGSRVQLRSTAYGTITIVLTGTAATALVLLTGRRVLRRIRSARPSARPANGTAG